MSAADDRDKEEGLRLLSSLGSVANKIKDKYIHTTMYDACFQEFAQTLRPLLERYKSAGEILEFELSFNKLMPRPKIGLSFWRGNYKFSLGIS